MHPNFGLPVIPGVSNNPFCPPSPNNFNPNVNPSMPMFQLTPNHLNSPHVFSSSSGFSGQAPTPFIPDLQVMKSVPPPSFIPPPTLPGNHIPKIPAPLWNSSHMPGQFQARPPTAPPYPPPIFPSNNYNNMNVSYSSSNVFNGQQNTIHQTANEFQRDHAPLFTSVSSNSSVSPVSNSFEFSSNRAGGNQNHENSAFPNGRNSSNFNRYKKPFRGMNSNQFGSKEMHGASGFGAYSSILPNGNEQVGQNSPFMVQSNVKIPHNANTFHNNRGKKRHHGTYPNFHSMNERNGYKNGNANNAHGGKNMKPTRNSDVAKPYSCDTCDRAFASEAELKFHLSEHIKCNSENCHFEAHPKIVALHKKMQHDTGYADAISKLKNADEIEKWRAERRSRFPTLKNIEKRKAEQTEKEARGEVIENKEFGKFKAHNSHQNGPRNNDHVNGRKRRRGAPKIRNAFSGTQYPHSVAKHTVSVSDSDSDEDSHIKLPKFQGMAALDSSEKDNLESLSQELPPDSHELLENFPQKRNANPMPMNNSESVDPVEKNISSPEQSIERDSADPIPSSSRIDLHAERDTSENQSIRKVDDLPPQNVLNSVIELDDDDDDEPPMEIPIARSVCSNSGSAERDLFDDSPVILETEKNTSENQSMKREARNFNHNSRATVHRDFNGRREYPELPRKSSLLEKLLADDIRHERNVIMQCIRHIVKKNFFDINVNN